MEAIEFLLKKLAGIIVVAVLLIIAFFFVQKFFPNVLQLFSLSGSRGSFFTDNWLPSPVNLQEFAKPITADLTANQYDGKLSPGTSYVLYNDKGMQIVNVPPDPSFNAKTSGYTDNSLYVRNISVYRGQSITTDNLITGEARTGFFANDRFPIYITDPTGKVFAVETAVATGQWSIPGWTRFSMRIRSLLPSHTPCQMLFVPDVRSPDASTQNKAVVQVFCN